jgi:hypothetical protein
VIEKQRYESALSQAIELTQLASPGGHHQVGDGIHLLEQKRSQLKLQVQNELSLRYRALESHSSMVQSLYHAACVRLQSVPPNLLLRLPHLVISDDFSQGAGSILKASDRLQLLKRSPVAMFSAVAEIAPSFAVQDAVFVAVFHMASASIKETQVSLLLTHFHKLKWLFEQFSDKTSYGLPSFMSKTKFIDCIQRIGCLVPANNLEQLYDALTDSDQMSFLQFCCSFMHTESQELIQEVQSIPVFANRGDSLHLGSVLPSDLEGPLQISHSQVPHNAFLTSPFNDHLFQIKTPLLSEVRSLQDQLSSPSRLRLKLKSTHFFESAKHLNAFTSLSLRNAPPPPPSPAFSEHVDHPSGQPLLSCSDFLQRAPDDLRSFVASAFITPPHPRLKAIVDMAHKNS